MRVAHVKWQKKTIFNCDKPFKNHRKVRVSDTNIKNPNRGDFQSILIMLKKVPGTPSYREIFIYELLSKVRHLGGPDFWHTASCADPEWPDLFSNLFQVYDDLSGKYSSLRYSGKCEFFDRNPSPVARHFQHRLDSYLQHFLKWKLHLLRSPILHYSVKIEF